MSDKFVDFAKSQMGAVERLIKGLPGIGGYIDKELRRDADKRVRESIALSLEQSKAALLDIQNRLLKGGGLALMDDVEDAIVKLQTLTDRVKTASYGYAGLFDAVRIKEAALDALNRFDLAMAQQVGSINSAIATLAQSVEERGNIGAAVDQVTKTVTDLSRLFDRRKEAIVSPDLLSQTDYAPEPQAMNQPMPDTLPAPDTMAPPQPSPEDARAAVPPDSPRPAVPPGSPASDVMNDPNAVG